MAKNHIGIKRSDVAMVKRISWVITVFAALLLTWLAIWSGLEYHAYVWVYSEDLMVAAFQYIVQGLWIISWVFGVVWVLILSMVAQFWSEEWGIDYLYHRARKKADTPQ